MRLAAEAVVAGHAGLVVWSSDLGVGARIVLLVLLALLAAGTVGLDRRLTPTGGGALMLGWAAVGVTTGIAAGAAPVAMTGLSLGSVVGLLALAAGLGLLVVAAARLVRAVPGWWRLLALPAAYVLVEFVLFPVTIGVYATHQPVAPFDETTPAGAQDVAIPTPDGESLAAWYTPPANGAVVILRHGSGAGSSKASVGDHAAVLARHGYGVLAMDARGFGESSGRPNALGWYGEADVAAALDWLAGRDEVDPDRIAALGLSMGGEEALAAAGADRRIRAVVAEGASGRGGADHAHFGYTGVEAVLDGAVMAATDGTAALFTRAPRPRPLAEAIGSMGTRPVLLIAGEEAAEASAGAYLAAVAPDTVTLWELPDTPHTRALERHYAEWEARVVGFLDAALA